MPLYIKILIGLALGIVWSFVSSWLGWNAFTIDWIDPFGVIFIRLLKFIAVPLVLFTVVTGIANLGDIGVLGRLGFKTLAIYLLTTITAVSIGLGLANLLKPGAFMDEEQRLKNRLAYEMWAGSEGVEIKDDKRLLHDPAYAHLRPDDIPAESEAAVKEKLAIAKKSKQEGPLQFLVDMVPENIVLSVSNNGLMLQVIFFALFFGITMLFVPTATAAPVLTFFNSIAEVFLKMVDLIMRAAPFFVFALMAGVIARMADTPAQVFEIFKGLGSYSITVIIGLSAVAFGLYPLLIKFLVRKLGFFSFIKGISPAQMLAFSTSSSAATLPVTMECVEQNLGISRKVSGFVLPIGATVNMDGTSLYQAVAVVFLAQLHMIDLTFGQQMTIVLTATLASIGSAAVPSAGLVMLMIVLISVGLNPAWIAIIFPVDRILDMCRTVVNVTGDAAVAAIVAASEADTQKP
jgi:Na+/H+-dicarboxylate symporter